MEILRAIDMDICPDNDAVIDRAMCGPCPYYKGFQMENALPCVKCAYYDENNECD